MKYNNIGPNEKFFGENKSNRNNQKLNKISDKQRRFLMKINKRN